MDRTQLLAARDTAGARYSAALIEFQAALVDLAALDQTLMNRRVATAADIPVRSFSNILQALPRESFAHPVYANAAMTDLYREIRMARDGYTAALS